MENQTRFDLEAAIADWQQELAAQADLTPVVRRELEAHLRDTVRELQKRGLSHEESFWLACRRLGRPQELDEEFAKADPARVWRERTFWMAGALLLMNFWGALLDQFWMVNPRLMEIRLENFLPVWVQFHLPNWLRNIREYDAVRLFVQLIRFLPIIVMAVFIAKGRLKYASGALGFVLASRTRFFVAMLVSFFMVHSNDIFFAQPGRAAAVLLFQFPWTFSLIALATWVFPTRNDRNLRTA